MDTAYTLFIEQGYHGTSIRQISDKAEFTIGGIYNHFSGKEEIFEAVVLEQHPIYVLLPLLDSVDADTAEEMIRKSADLAFQNLNQRKDFMNLLFIEVVEFKAKHVPQLFKEIFPIVTAYAQKIMQKGGMRDIPAPTLLVAFLALLFVYFFLNQFGGTMLLKNVPGFSLQALVDILLYGVVERAPERN